MKSIRIRALFFSGLFAAATTAMAHENHAHHGGENPMDKNRPATLANESIYQLSDRWTTEDGRTVALSSLAGKPTVIAMVYTSCQSACPMTISDLKRIETAIPSEVRSKVAFAIFSFDSKRDTPDKLSEFAKTGSLDLSRWTLFHGSKAAVRKLAAVLGIQYREDASGNFDHSNVITLVDAAGVIRQQQVGLGKDPKDFVARISELISRPKP